MIFIPGGTFRMGSDKHYPEEAPVHRVTVDEFWYIGGDGAQHAARGQSFLIHKATAANPGNPYISITDVDPQAVKIGDRVEMTFRKLYTAGGVHNYFWKARPIRD